MAVLGGPLLGVDERAAHDPLEVAVGEAVAVLGLLRRLGVQREAQPLENGIVA